MKLRRLIPISVTLMAFLAGNALFAYQAEDATNAVTKAAKKAKKTKKTAKDTADAAANTATSPTDTVKRPAAIPEKTFSDSEVTAAKASGKVWVNTESGVSHKEGKWYGTTKQGKFMTEQEAVKAGYRASKTK